MTRPDLSIRPARLEDYSAFSRLFDGLDEQHRASLPWLFKAPDRQPRSFDYFNELLQRPEDAIFVAEADQLVGVAHGLLRRSPDLPIFVQQRYGVLDGLVVDPAWRRRGVGRLLTQAVEDWAHGNGAPWVELSVYDFNAEARSFYESLGYLPVRTVLLKPHVDTVDGGARPFRVSVR